MTRVLPLMVLSSGLLMADGVAHVGLSYSTYLRSGFTPSAMATDTAGNLYITGAQLDPLASQTVPVVLKLNPRASQYIYIRPVSGLTNAVAQAIAVDGVGNAWITGTATISHDDSRTRRSHSGTIRPIQQTFVAKLDPTGETVFSEVVVGRGVQSNGQAVLITPAGDVLVSGLAITSGFPSTRGAYSVHDTAGRPYLMKLDPNGRVLLSATGVGGSSIALDTSGNVYVSGSTLRTDYPTTPGAYQTQFGSTFSCAGFPIPNCFGSTNQYVSKLDAAASTLLYSTGLNGLDSGPTANAGLAVDAAGNAYLTGVTQSGQYPFTTTPGKSPVAIPFVTKLDAAGKSLIFSVPQGGSGLQYEPVSNSVYVTGSLNTPWALGLLPSSVPPPPPPGLTDLPVACLTNNLTSITEGYAAKVDGATGETLAAVLIGSARVSLVGTALAGVDHFWFTGTTGLWDVPYTPGALFPPNPVLGQDPGAYLGAVDFSQTSAVAPAVACVLDAADYADVGLVAPGQLLSLFGANLGPSTGVAAPGGVAPSLAGVSIMFDGTPAQLLYVSSSHINLAVPLEVGSQASTVMQVLVNGVNAAPRLFPVRPSNPALFATPTFLTLGCPGYNGEGSSVSVAIPVVHNDDGGLNSCGNPAKAGSAVSFYVNGAGEASSGFDATAGSVSADVVSVARENAFVWRVDIRLPVAVRNEGAGTIRVTVREGNVLVGPLQLFYLGFQHPQIENLVWMN